MHPASACVRSGTSFQHATGEPLPHACRRSCRYAFSGKVRPNRPSTLVVIHALLPFVGNATRTQSACCQSAEARASNANLRWHAVRMTLPLSPAFAAGRYAHVQYASSVAAMRKSENRYIPQQEFVQNIKKTRTRLAPRPSALSALARACS